MPRRTLLAEQLSGKKRQPTAGLDTDPLDKEDKETQQNFRRLSTLYGANVKTVAMTKERRKTKLGLGVGVQAGAVMMGRWVCEGGGEIKRSPTLLTRTYPPTSPLLPSPLLLSDRPPRPSQ